MSMSPIHLIVIDTETGGFDPANCCIIELAAQHVIIDRTIRRVLDGDELIFHRYILPDRPVAEQAASVNGYNPELWAEMKARSFLDVARDFLDWIEQVPHEGLMWAGSNIVGFDLPFLRSDLARHTRGWSCGSWPGKPKFSHRTLDTASLCFPLFARGETEHCGIADLRRWAGCDGEQHHNALWDVKDTVRVIRAYFEREVWRVAP